MLKTGEDDGKAGEPGAGQQVESRREEAVGDLFDTAVAEASGVFSVWSFLSGQRLGYLGKVI